ncbi:MAG: hypothetical protein A2144_14080 [Chloroflexi bacterium RBG_16_50_9]|nr:MAG: hypothetical protein A2144_14080 [Chloroflexi bacterium RBG_16_50_9]
MSLELIGLLGVILLLVLLAARMWNALAMAIIGFFGIAIIRGFGQALTTAGQTPYLFIGKYELAVIPMFVLMGMVVSEAGIGAECYYTMNKWFGHMRGGLAIATTWACALFAAITGMSVSGIVVMSKIALPEMQRYNYDTGLSAGAIAASSTMGILIPPSIGFVIYGILTEISIGKLFMAGIIPGILEALFYMITIYIICRFNPKKGPPGPKSTFKEKVFSLKNTWAVLVLFVLVMGGLYMGVFTPTEAGAIGAFGAIIIAIVSRKLSTRNFPNILLETGIMTAMILLLMMGVSLFQKFVAFSELPFAMGNFIAGLAIPRTAVFASIVLMYIILGCFLPAIATLMLTIPIIYPVILSMGYDPIWYGVIMVRMIEMAGITPPVGIDCFVLSGISGIPLGTIFRGVVPFIIADVCHVALLIAVPSLSLFLPSTMM